MPSGEIRELTEEELEENVCPECGEPLPPAHLESRGYNLAEFITECRGCGATFKS